MGLANFRSFILGGFLLTTPFLFGANDKGCTEPTPTRSDLGRAGSPPTCVDNVRCIHGAVWDPVACACVPAKDAGRVCIDNMMCIQGTVWDPVACTCVPAKGTSLEDAGGACVTAADCHGILPHLCKVCDADGGTKTSCAHWACRDGHCTVAICD